MNGLVFVKKDNLFTDSLIIANGTGNSHHAIQQLISKYGNKLASRFGKVAFEMRPSTSGQMQKVFILSEPQASAVITLLRNNDIVVDFKMELVRQFYELRSVLLERKTSEWMETRIKGKLVRRAETDAIADLIAYAKNQGSKNADKLYMTYTKLVNKTVGLESGQRDKATFKVLQVISMIEDMILHTIQEDMTKGVYYKKIYQHCKTRASQMIEFMYLPEQKMIA